MTFGKTDNLYEIFPDHQQITESAFRRSSSCKSRLNTCMCAHSPTKHSKLYTSEHAHTSRQTQHTMWARSPFSICSQQLFLSLGQSDVKTISMFPATPARRHKQTWGGCHGNNLPADAPSTCSWHQLAVFPRDVLITKPAGDKERVELLLVES